MSEMLVRQFCMIQNSTALRDNKGRIKDSYLSDKEVTRVA